MMIVARPCFVETIHPSTMIRIRTITARQTMERSSRPPITRRHLHPYICTLTSMPRFFSAPPSIHFIWLCIPWTIRLNRIMDFIVTLLLSTPPLPLVLYVALCLNDRLF